MGVERQVITTLREHKSYTQKRGGLGRKSCKEFDHVYCPSCLLLNGNWSI